MPNPSAAEAPGNGQTTLAHCWGGPSQQPSTSRSCGGQNDTKLCRLPLSGHLHASLPSAPRPVPTSRSGLYPRLFGKPTPLLPAFSVRSVSAPLRFRPLSRRRIHSTPNPAKRSVRSATPAQLPCDATPPPSQDPPAASRVPVFPHRARRLPSSNVACRRWRWTRALRRQASG